MKEHKKWIKHTDPENKYSARLTFASRTTELPADAVISITLGEQFSIWRTITNGIINQFIMKQLSKNPGLLYAELAGDVKAGYGLTMTVWTDKAMTSFRDKGSHKFAMRYFSWVFYSGKAQAYFLTYKAKKSIPTALEARNLAKEYGRHFDGGKMLKKQRRPETVS